MECLSRSEVVVQNVVEHRHWVNLLNSMQILEIAGADQEAKSNMKRIRETAIQRERMF